MLSLDTEKPVSLTYTKIQTSTLGTVIASNGFKWSAADRIWRPAGEPWLRRELLIIWTFLIVLGIMTYFIVRLLLQMQSNVNAETRSTIRLTQQVASVAETQDDQKNKLTQVQASYQQVAGAVGDLGHQVAANNKNGHELTDALKSLAARVQGLEHQQQVERASASAAAPRLATEAATEAARAAKVKAPSRWTPVSGIDHVHQFLTDIAAPKAFEIKKVGEEENVWLVSRSGTPVVVRPFAVNSLGIWVHCSTDGRDYILTPSGGWMAGSPRP